MSVDNGDSNNNSVMAIIRNDFACFGSPDFNMWNDLEFYCNGLNSTLLFSCYCFSFMFYFR